MICSNAWCYEEETPWFTWWLPRANVPLCQACYECWWRSLGYARLT